MRDVTKNPLWCSYRQHILSDGSILRRAQISETPFVFALGATGISQIILGSLAVSSLTPGRKNTMTKFLIWHRAWTKWTGKGDTTS